MATDGRRRVALITGITGQVRLPFHTLLIYSGSRLYLELIIENIYVSITRVP